MNKHLTVIEGKGTLRILAALRGGTSRFNALARTTGLNMQVMSDRLLAMEAAGLIHRDQVSIQPPHTQYTLTPEGRYYAAYARHLVTVPQEEDDDLPF